MLKKCCNVIFFITILDYRAPFLPTNPIIKTGGEKAIDSISSAPFGSALACLISYGYIKMLGSSGLTNSTKMAILNANYIKERLSGKYEVLYSGENGRAAHISGNSLTVTLMMSVV